MRSWRGISTIFLGGGPFGRHYGTSPACPPVPPLSPPAADALCASSGMGFPRHAVECLLCIKNTKSGLLRVPYIRKIAMVIVLSFHVLRIALLLNPPPYPPFTSYRDNHGKLFFLFSEYLLCTHRVLPI